MSEHEQTEDQESTPAVYEGRDTELAKIEPSRWLAVETKVKELMCAEISDVEWDVFKAEAAAYGLNPVKREYIPLMIGNKRVEIKTGNRTEVVWAKEYRGYVTQAGMIALAERTNLFDGIVGPMWAGEHTKGEFVEYWLAAWGVPQAAKVEVYRKDRTRPTVAVVTMSRARLSWQDNPDGKKGSDNKILKTKQISPGPWTEDPAMMMGVRATTDAVRKSGLLTALPADPEQLRIAELTAGGLLLAIDEGQSDRVAANRRAHAIAAARGLDHEDIGTVAQTILPDTESLADLDEGNLRTVGDVIDETSAEDLAEMTGRHETEIIGEHRVIAPEPDQPPAEDGGISQEQLDWLEARQDKIDWRKLTDDQQADFANRKALSFTQARDLILKVSAAVEEVDQEAAVKWSAFWGAVKVAGFGDSKGLSKAAGGQVVPDDINGAYNLLGQAMAMKAEATTGK